MDDLKIAYQQLFPAVARYVAKRGGTLEEAKDVFHDALLVYCEKSVDQRGAIRQDVAAYTFGVARHLWHKRYREHLRQVSLDRLMADFEGMDPVDFAEEPVPAAGRIVRVLQAAGEKCMRLLTAFYYEKLDMGELATRFGFSGTRSATVQKFKCLQKVKQVVKEKSLQYEDFVA